MDHLAQTVLQRLIGVAMPFAHQYFVLLRQLAAPVNGAPEGADHVVLVNALLPHASGSGVHMAFHIFFVDPRKLMRQLWYAFFVYLLPRPTQQRARHDGVLAYNAFRLGFG